MPSIELYKMGLCVLEQLVEQICAVRDCENRIRIMRPESNLEMLMARYQGGDFAAATALVNLVSSQLHRFFMVQSASREDADDLLQETWLRVHKVRHTYRPGQPVLAWFYGIARHIRIDHYRKTVRTKAREQRLEETSNVATASGNFGKAEGLEVLLATLPESQREVIEMLKISGMSLEEVARATSASVGSVKQKVHRAYKKLREAPSVLQKLGRQRIGMP